MVSHYQEMVCPQPPAFVDRGMTPRVVLGRDPPFAQGPLTGFPARDVFRINPTVSLIPYFAALQSPGRVVARPSVSHAAIAQHATGIGMIRVFPHRARGPLQCHADVTLVARCA